MRRLGEYRILRWEFKLLYVVGVLLAGYAISWPLELFQAGPVALSLVSSVLTVYGLVLGARMFRGRGEPVRPPRPWWKMTARRKLSRRLGILFAVLCVLGVVSSILLAFGIPPGQPAVDAPGALASVLAELQFGAIAFLYLNSAFRLPKPGAPRLVPTFRPKRELP